MTFIHDDFLLSTEAARRLYHDFAAPQPILDYHSHLPPADIAADRRFADLSEIWLVGDHYKWRAMRADGVGEHLCTGDATPREKFMAWAGTVPQTLRNPLYHWTHLELKRHFGIDDLLGPDTAARIWEVANEKLAAPELSAQGILRRFDVRALCTTDDPADDLGHHRTLADARPGFRVYPTFRPDRALDVHRPEPFNAWIERLATAANVEIRSCRALLDALGARHELFHAHGCRLSDHGLESCFSHPCSDAEADAIFNRARTGRAATPEERERFASNLMLFFGQLDAEKGWTKQLHLGALRDASTRLSRGPGADSGGDSIGDLPQAAALATYLDLLDRENALPKTVIYNLNPADNYPVASIAGSFQDGSVPAKIQLGSGWWFLDQKEAMEWQLNALSNLGLLSRFLGMVTDSRSFMSFPRHEYFRRMLCNLVGRDVENGEIPDDDGLLRPLIEGICYGNAERFLGLG